VIQCFLSFKQTDDMIKFANGWFVTVRTVFTWVTELVLYILGKNFIPQLKANRKWLLLFTISKAGSQFQSLY